MPARTIRLVLSLCISIGFNALVSADELLLADRLEYRGVAVEDPAMTTWGSSPLKDDQGVYHLFVARWPSSLKVNPGWRSHSEIAHFCAPSPTGPFQFQEVALAGTHKDGNWEKFAPHNPLIKKFGDTYALIYIARMNPKANNTQRIGLATSSSLSGPWHRRDEPLLSPSIVEGENWTFGSGVGVNNPAMLQMPDGRFFLYFKAKKKSGGAAKMGLAIADHLEGPYVIQKDPVTDNQASVEDGYVFLGSDQRVHFITTDNHGILQKGGGLHWVSDDGLKFRSPTQAYYPLDHYIKKADYPNAKTIYGPGIWKCERPQILVENGEPKWLYAPSGISLDGDPATESHVFEIK
ncbi:glycoside hydrolase family protein [Neorhodopirellula lusitana]|uniref:glycoside hydrolase family protein n=1 Tax=Neorhodopirellula lusitana TaxID=445327 RepID=UPI0024B8590E|nr:glycoside hydrolase family protein [Neorhodopirellula lusitana]